MNTISAIIPTVPATGLINGLTSHAMTRININAMMINDRNVAMLIDLLSFVIPGLQEEIRIIDQFINFIFCEFIFEKAI